VGTSVAAFVGPSATGPTDLPTRITNYDQFIDLFGSTGPNAPHLIHEGRLYHMSFGVRGFFENGGQTAYVVRVDNSTPGSLDLQTSGGLVTAVTTAKDPAVNPEISVVDLNAGPLAVAVPSGTRQAPANPSPIPGDATHDVLLDDASGFAVGDEVTDGTVDAVVDEVLGNWIRPSVATTGATIRLADISPASGSVRLTANADTVTAGSRIVVTSDGGNELACTVDYVSGDRLVITPDSGGPTVGVDGANPRVVLAPHTIASATSAISSSPSSGVFVVADASGFLPGDVVTDGTAEATILEIDGGTNTVTLSGDLPGAANLAIVDVSPARTSFRVTRTGGALKPGALIHLTDGGGPGTYAVVSQVAGNGLVTLAEQPARTATIASTSGQVEVLTFALVVTHGTQREVFADLSTNPANPRYFLSAVDSDLITLQEPDPPPLVPAQDRVPAPLDRQALTGAVVGDLATLGVADYQQAIDTLRRVDDVNILCAPDVASMDADRRRSVQQAMITHCLEQADRITVLDPPPGTPPSGPGGIEDIRADVQSERGFAALYYPWVQVLDPTRVPPQTPRRMAIPPSGHIAGIMARTDGERGVFKAPANTPIRNVLGVERQLTDREQAPLNRGGTNVLRVLPGSNSVIVWGARTTVDPVITDWMYVNVRRLLLFIEESIELGIRWAVFEPNDLGLWKSLERVIRAFLRTQWQAGALFGATEDQAFSVRIDEGLNPPSVRNVGRLNIEIKVAPVRPAEFIVVRIGLFDGGAEVEEA
jgi:hypothetical protein